LSFAASVLVTTRNAGFQSAGFVDNRKVVLMMNHRRRQHFFGQRQELLWRKCPAMTVGYSMRSGTSSRSVECSIAAAPTRPPRLRAFASRPARDAVLPFLPIENDEMLGEARRVIVEGTHLSPARPALPLVVRKRWPYVTAADTTSWTVEDSDNSVRRMVNGHDAPAVEDKESTGLGARTGDRPSHPRGTRPNASPSGS
jgi:hypothetical protein